MLRAVSISYWEINDGMPETGFIFILQMQTDQSSEGNSSGDGKKEEKKEDKKENAKSPKNKVKTIDLPITSKVPQLSKEELNLLVEKEVS